MRNYLLNQFIIVLMLDLSNNKKGRTKFGLFWFIVKRFIEDSD